ncbi:MAG: bifunctional hydroxymethylpyrimidine kinase/phosphomethylpyrimidine kinase [Deltaproteobacteria bacterium]|nr:bifunctional hydroxymethylpyrimidine kinase/phosphomethylpyrimidine kinase [Deltaproteobacteria bacterium]
MKRILTIAGSDSGGGAGIQADLKAITLLGGFGMSAITALTAQNTVGVMAVHQVPVDFIAAQIDAVFTDIGVDAVKTGMLANSDVVQLVAEKIAWYSPEVVVVDPVMVAKSGDPLLAEEARDALIQLLLPRATMVTPNLPEASVLAGQQVTSETEMRQAARKIQAAGPAHVLIKGGHLSGAALDLLFDGQEFYEFRAARLDTKNTHGTGCTYAAAIATFLAMKMTPRDAVSQAKRFITDAIRHGLPLGRGHGPTNPYAAVMKSNDGQGAGE